MNKNGEYSLKDCLFPIWEGDFSYNESAMPVSDEKGQIVPIDLLYPIKEITAIRSWDLQTLYQADKDYTVEDGRLVIPAGSRIPVTTWEQLHPTEKTDESKEALKGGYLYYSEFFFQKQIAVSYTHEGPFPGTIPLSHRSTFFHTLQMLEEGKQVKIHFYGDSITVGGNSTGLMKVPPFMPTWPELIVEVLKNRYPQADIVYSNTAVGGKCSRWATENSEERLKAYPADLVVIAFGMNDGPKSPDRYGIYNRQLILDARETNPDCDILLVTTTLPNKEFKNFGGNQGIFGAVLKNLAANYDHIETADMSRFHADLLTRKRFIDCSANHINHANDYLCRAYAQVCLQAMTGKAGF